MDEPKKLLDALRWITGILESENIPYQISGGLAAHIYGSPRPVNDIDICVPERDIPKIFERTKEYVKSGPARYTDEKWDLEYLFLVYNDQEIDIGGAETTRITVKNEKGEDTGRWMNLPTNFSASEMVEWHGMILPLEPKKSLAAYKKHLNGEHQRLDISALDN